MFTKTLKKAIAFVLVIAFVLTLVPISGMAASATIKTGENIKDLAARLYPNTSSKYEYGSLSSENGVFGKKADDKVYKINSTAMVLSDGVYIQDPEKTSYGIASGGDIQLNDIHDPAKDKDAVFEFSFCFTGVNNKIAAQIRGSGYKGNAFNSKSDNTSFSITPTSAKLGYDTKAVDLNLGINKWHNATVVLDAEQDSTVIPLDGTKTYTHRMYIDGVLVDSDTVKDTSWLIHDWVLFRLANGAKHIDVYYDNLDAYEIDDASEFIPTEATRTILSTTTEGYEIIEDTIAAPSTATVADVKSAVDDSLKDGDDIRFYNDNYTQELSDADLAKNAKVVIASKRPGTDIENAFSYYSVEKWVYKFPGINTGDTLISIGGGSSEFTEIVSESNGLGGKKSDDAYLKFTDATGNKYLQAGMYAKSAYEFSLMLTDECDNSGVTLESGMYTNEGTDKHSSGNSRFTFSQSGVYHGSTKKADMPLNQWVNFAIIAPKGPVAGTEIMSDGQVVGYGEYDDTYEFYMNGEFIFAAHGTGDFHATGAGIRHNRFSGSSSEGIPTCYLDNIRVVPAGIEYIPLYDKPVVYSADNLDSSSNTITITDSNFTVKDLKSSIGESDSYDIRVYNVNSELLSDEAVIADGYSLVIAANNNSEVERAYSYYTLRQVAGKYAFDVPAIISENGNTTASVKLYNYSGDEKRFCVYLAVYSGDELISVTESELKCETGKDKTVTPSIACPKGHTTKLFVWKSDKITPELNPVIK